MSNTNPHLTAPCPTLSPLTDINEGISYDPDTNTATYGCVPGYTPTITNGTAQRMCQSDGTSAGNWTGTPPTVTCAREYTASCT